MERGFKCGGKGAIGTFKGGRKQNWDNWAEFWCENLGHVPEEGNPHSPPCPEAGLQLRALPHGASTLFQVNGVLNRRPARDPLIPDVSPYYRRLVTHSKISYTASSAPVKRSFRTSFFLHLISSQNKCIVFPFGPAFSSSFKDTFCLLDIWYLKGAVVSFSDFIFLDWSRHNLLVLSYNSSSSLLMSHLASPFLRLFHLEFIFPWYRWLQLQTRSCQGFTDDWNACPVLSEEFCLIYHGHNTGEVDGVTGAQVILWWRQPWGLPFLLVVSNW